VDAADVGRVVVEEADEPERGREVGLDLLGPLTPKAAAEIAVAGVQVATDPDRPAIVQSLVPAGPGAPHEEIDGRRHEGRDTG